MYIIIVEQNFIKTNKSGFNVFPHSKINKLKKKVVNNLTGLHRTKHKHLLNTNHILEKQIQNVNS